MHPEILVLGGEERLRDDRGIALNGTKMRRSVASSAISRPLLAKTRLITGGW